MEFFVSAEDYGFNPGTHVDGQSYDFAVVLLR